MTFYVIPDFCQIFPELPAEIFFRKLAWVCQGHNKKVPKLQVYEHPPATLTTLSIKVVIVVLY